MDRPAHLHDVPPARPAQAVVASQRLLGGPVPHHARSKLNSVLKRLRNHSRARHGTARHGLPWQGAMQHWCCCGTVRHIASRRAGITSRFRPTPLAGQGPPQQTPSSLPPPSSPPTVHPSPLFRNPILLVLASLSPPLHTHLVLVLADGPHGVRRLPQDGGPAAPQRRRHGAHRPHKHAGLHNCLRGQVAAVVAAAAAAGAAAAAAGRHARYSHIIFCAGLLQCCPAQGHGLLAPLS